MIDPTAEDSPEVLPPGDLEDQDFVPGKHEFVSCITMAKAQGTLIHGLTIQRSELSSLVLCKRLQYKVLTALAAPADAVSTLGDSTCIIGGLESRGTSLNPYMHSRYGEVHDINKKISAKCHLEITEHVESAQNIADLATRMDGSLAAIGPDSLWQEGPSWLKRPRYTWPATRDFIRVELPQEECKAPIKVLAMRLGNLTMDFILRILNSSLNLSEAETCLSGYSLV